MGRLFKTRKIIRKKRLNLDSLFGKDEKMKDNSIQNSTLIYRLQKYKKDQLEFGQVFKEKMKEFEKIKKKSEKKEQKEVQKQFKVDPEVAKLDDDYSFEPFLYNAQKEIKLEKLKNDLKEAAERKKKEAEKIKKEKEIALKISKLKLAAEK